MCPDVFRHRIKITVFSVKTEEMVAVYNTDFLDSTAYESILSSAKMCAEQLNNKTAFSAKKTKKRLLNRAVVVFIFARIVDRSIAEKLPELVCRNGGDGYNNSFLPCVVDLTERHCVFDSLTIPDIWRLAKNHGISLIRRCVFGGRLNLADSSEKYDYPDYADPEQSLISWFYQMKKDVAGNERIGKKRFAGMKHGDIFIEDGWLYLKWHGRAIMTAMEIDDEAMTAEVDGIEFCGSAPGEKEIKARIGSFFEEKIQICL